MVEPAKYVRLKKCLNCNQLNPDKQTRCLGCNLLLLVEVEEEPVKVVECDDS